ncbi:tyrosine-type recombinase/integrase [Paenirhodobacter sp.]|uniref:tyrosine-type recombinase/integrase n=1 Tax=Paenirhodobacter sp. TaxID=1965326 RepID=UPI003B504C3F
MPKMAPELSAIEIKRLKHPGGGLNVMVAVGGVSGLYMQLLPSGGRTWVLRTRVGGKTRDMGLGGYPEVGLAAARDKAREAKDKIRQGIDPVEERKAARASLIAARNRGLTFADAVDRYLASRLEEFRNDKHKAQWRSSLDSYAKPQIGDMLVQDITVQDVLLTLQPIWASKTETASRLRGRIEAVLSWATVAGHRTGDNPARWGGNLKELLPKPSKVAKSDNQPALSLTDAPTWFGDLRTREGMGSRALEFLTLCASRSGEVRGATWDEIDLDNALWVIPASRMKMDREHRVPLTPAAVALLKALPRLQDNPLVFPAARGGQLSDMTLSATMKRMHESEVEAGRKGWLDSRNGRPAVPHGLRSTFRDWAAETGQARDMAEIALAHRVGSDVERAYRRSDMVERRRAMMADWAKFLGVK